MDNMKKLLLLTGLIISGICAMAQYSAIRVAKSGTGNPVLFLPGFTSPGSVWEETSRQLAGNHTKLFVTYAGFNNVPPVETPWYDKIKSDVITYLKNEKLTNLTIIGHSMGGTLALDIAAEEPDLVSTLVIVDGLPCMLDVMMPGVLPEQIKYESPYNKRMLEMSDDAFKQTATMMVQGMTKRPEMVDTLLNWSLVADRKTYVYGYTDLLKIDLRPVLNQIKAKTLVLAAPFPNSDIVNATLAKQYAGLQAKTIAIATDSRHFIMFDQPEWLTTHINTFLSEQ